MSQRRGINVLHLCLMGNNSGKSVKYCLYAKIQVMSSERTYLVAQETLAPLGKVGIDLLSVARRNCVFVLNQHSHFSKTTVLKIL